MSHLGNNALLLSGIHIAHYNTMPAYITYDEI
jgi:hypothetical protein